MAQTLTERKTGDLISQVFQLVFACLGRLLAIHLVFWIPVGLAFGGLMLLALAGGDEAASAILLVVGFLLLIVLQPVPGAAAMVALSDEFTGSRTPISVCFGRAFARLGTLLLIGLAVGLLVLLGIITLGIMSFVWVCTYYVAAQVAVLEDTGAGRALSRSAELTRGSRWEVFAVILLLWMVGYAIQMGIALPITLLELAGGGDGGGVGSFLGQVVSSLVGSMLTAAAGVAIYFNQRVRKEGFDVEQLVDLVDEIGRRAGPEPEQGTESPDAGWTYPDERR